jgi:hypothetical protein
MMRIGRTMNPIQYQTVCARALKDMSQIAAAHDHIFGEKLDPLDLHVGALVVRTARVFLIDNMLGNVWALSDLLRTEGDAILSKDMLGSYRGFYEKMLGAQEAVDGCARMAAQVRAAFEKLNSSLDRPITLFTLRID